jgi:uncharacterized membrane protein YkvA (DUF1232 family)
VFEWWRLLVVAAVALAASWGALLLLAHRLPPGLPRDLAAFLPACVTTARRLRGHPAVPRRAKVALLIAVVWTLSPIDLLPEFLPVIGPLDDIVVIALALRYAARAVPREVLARAWPGEPWLLERLLDGRRRSPRPVSTSPTTEPEGAPSDD